MTGIEQRDLALAVMRAFAERVAGEKFTVVLKAEKGRNTSLHGDVVRFYVGMSPPLMVAALCVELQRLRRSLTHISETCIEDPDVAQFAHRVLNGTAEPPPEKPAEVPA